MIKQEYYTDEELVEMVQNPLGEHAKSTHEIGKLIRERFVQKENARCNLQQRVNVAAEHLGHQIITDLIDEGC